MSKRRKELTAAQVRLLILAGELVFADEWPWGDREEPAVLRRAIETLKSWRSAVTAEKKIRAKKCQQRPNCACIVQGYVTSVDPYCDKKERP